MRFYLVLLLVFAGITVVYPEMDYMECARNCETMTGIWACDYAYCALYDMASYNAMTPQQQCAFDCIWEYRRCKSGVQPTGSGSQYYENPGAAYRAEKEATCDNTYRSCMEANEIGADFSELDDYCVKKESDCYTALLDKYCKPVQASCVTKCGEAKPPEQPAEEKKPCYGTTTPREYCNSYCKSKRGNDCAFIAYVQWEGTVIDCSCNCPAGGETYYKIDCTKPLPLAQQATDKCRGVECPDKCEGGIMHTKGSCNPGTGACTYREEQCPQGCEGSTKCKPVSMQGEVFYYDSSGKKVPLRFVKIEAIAVKDSHIYAYGHLSTDENGKFVWDDPKAFQPGYEISVEVLFDESKGRLFLVDNDPTFPLRILYEDSIPVEDKRLSNYQMDLTSHKVQALSDAAKVFVTAQKAVEFKEKVFKKSQTVKERVFVHNPGGNSHISEVWKDEDPSAPGMRLLEMSSSFTSSYIEDTIYHEYCHHIQDELFNTKESHRGKDHGGYYTNPDSGWGLVEGWAEYCAWEMKNYYKDNPDYDLYRIRGVAFNLELNYQMREKVFREKNIYSTPSVMEEMAIASLLVDLRDSPQSRGGMDDDFVSIPISTLMDAYSQKRDFGDGEGARHVKTLRDLYVALKESGYKPLLEYYDKDKKITQLDKIFIMHGAYQDLNKNGRWDDGEPPGYSGNGAAASEYRSDLEALNGSEVVLALVDQDGSPIKEGVMVHVDVKFSGDNAYLSYSYDVPVSEGALYIPYPPREYDATITMYAYQPGTGSRAAEQLVLTTQEFYDKVDGSKPIGTYSAKVTVQKNVPCKEDYECVYKGQGLSCRSGLCTAQPAKASSGLPQGTGMCNANSDCGQGYVCEAHKCASKEEPSGLCLVLPALVGLAAAGSVALRRTTR
ncbi:MAG: hypothetical protein N3G76_00240 [Candidatus Micrarchaeota archaeon]|nr:hypothetical protein [Candidatus Micrarchaeota archaeon]